MSSISRSDGFVSPGDAGIFFELFPVLKVFTRYVVLDMPGDV